MGVSCVVPVHNGESFLAEAIESIIAQTHRPLEVIVIDNGSTDGSAALARSFGPPVRVLQQEDRGPPGGRNRGILAARHGLVAFLDADDLFLPTKLEQQVARFAMRPALEISLCTAENFWEPQLAAERARYQAAGRLRATHVFTTMLARRDVFKRVGLIDEKHVFGDHIEWFTRAADADTVIEVLPHVLVRRRMHPNSLTHRMRNLDPFLEVIGERLARRRSGTMDDQPRARAPGPESSSPTTS